MKRNGEKEALFGVFAGLMLLLTTNPTYVVKAEEQDPGQTGQEIVQNQQEDIPETMLNYIYIEAPVIEQYEIQTIGIGLNDPDWSLVQDIRLGYSENEQNYEVSYQYSQDNLAVFEYEASEIGTCSIQYVDIVGSSDIVRIELASGAVSIMDAEYSVVGVGEIGDCLEAETEEYEYETDPDSEIITDAAALASHGIQFDVKEMKPVGADGNVIIVLDPGHDATHPGAQGNGLREEVLTLKIAQYCREELEKYDNLTVYMTREDGSCLNKKNNAECLKARCNFAASVNANILVSIHIDSGRANATGPMVIVAKTGIYRDDLASVTQGIGQAILDELTKLGLASRGLCIRMSDSSGAEFYYPNGAKADYYSITRNCIKAGVPGIIVEHCFISNPSDVANYLSSEEKLQALGVADATGIANYFSLKKKEVTNVGDALYKDSTDPYVVTEDYLISDFVALLYDRVLDRTPRIDEVSYWVKRIEEEQLNGSSIVKRFVNSKEFKLHDYSNEDFVEKLYEIYLGRESEEEGKEHWLKELERGCTRLEIADRFGASMEFELVCGKYGMAQGDTPMKYTKLYPEIAEFIATYYEGLLNREPEEEGLEHWAEFLVQGGSAAELTKKFINSAEFKLRDLDREEFVEGLYHTYLGRASDEEGKAHWMEMLPTMSYEEKIKVIQGFIRSKEYHIFCSRYGIAVGTLE